jgi:hypothetical protein
VQHGLLAQRVGGVRRGGEPDDVGRPARVEGRGDQRVGHLAVQPGAALDGGRDRPDVGEIGEHRPAPQRVRPPQEGQRLAAVARAGEQPTGLREVDVEVEAVAVVAGLQPGGRRAEACPQPRDVGVQGLAGGVRRLRGPQRVHEVVDGHGAAFGEREQREHGPALGPWHLDGGAVDDQAQRPEHLHPRVRFAHFLPLPGTACRLSGRRQRTPEPCHHGSAALSRVHD